MASNTININFPDANTDWQITILLPLKKILNLPTLSLNSQDVVKVSTWQQLNGK